MTRFTKHRKLSSVLLLAFCLPAHGAEGLRLHVLDCGSMRGTETEMFLPAVGERPERVDMVNRCFLIEHEQGTLLWDAGFPHTLAWRVKAALYWLSSLGRSSIDLGPNLAKQLAEAGFPLADINYLVFSHSHFDHVGQANDFAGVTWLVQKRERDWVFTDGDENEHADPSLMKALQAGPTQLLEGDYDVFGDGSVEILSTPGHTPGHQSLYIDLPKRGPVILAGDLYHTPWNRELRVGPSFNTDAEETVRSMERLESIATERNAEVWIQHWPASGVPAPAIVE